LAAAGYVVLKFNFRGVGKSGGSFDNMIGEKRDVLAALKFLESQPNVDRKKAFLAGYSFGAGVSLMVAMETPKVIGYAGVGCPNDFFKYSSPAKTKNPKLPLLFIGGSEDPWCRIDPFKATVTKANTRRHPTVFEPDCTPTDDYQTALDKLEKNLNDLQTDYVDVTYVHCLGAYDPERVKCSHWPPSTKSESLP